jgi:hypothetical protein
MGLKLNVQGLLGIAAIALMVGVVFARGWQIPWLYFGAAVLFYAGAVIALSVWQEEEKGRQAALEVERREEHLRDPRVILEELYEGKVVMFTLYRALLGCHLAFAFQAVGLLIDFSDAIVVRLGYFLASLAIGLAIPFLLLTRKEENPPAPSLPRTPPQQ